MLSIEHLVIFVVCDVLVSFMILYFMWYDMLFKSGFYSFCLCLHILYVILSVFVTNKRTYIICLAYIF